MAVQKVIQIDVDELKALGGIDNLNKALGTTEQSTKSLRTQLREAQLEVATLSEKFGATSNQAIEAAKKAAKLKDAIGDAKTLTDAFNPDAKFKALGGALTGVAGGFAAVQGALGALGIQSDGVEKALLRVNSAMALSQGLNALGESIDSFETLGKKATSALAGIRAGVAATGLGLLVVTLGLVVANWDKIKESISGANKEQEVYNSLQSETIKNASKEVSQLDTLYKTTQNHNLSLKQRKDAVDKLQEQYPYYFKNIQDEAILNGKATDSYKKLRQAIIDVAMSKAAQGKIEEISAKYLENEIELNKQRAKAVQDYKTAQDETIVKGGTGEGAGTTYVRTREEKQYAAKLQYNDALKKQAENQKALNAELKPYLDIVQKTSGLEETLSNKKEKIEKVKKEKNVKDAKDEEKLIGLSREEVKQRAFEEALKREEERKQKQEQLNWEYDQMSLERYGATLSERINKSGEALKQELAQQQIALDAQKAIDEQRIQSEQNVQQAKKDALSAGLDLLQAFAGENEAIAIGILAVQKGLAIADIISNASKGIAVSQANLSMIPALLPPGVPNPAYPVALASHIKNVAATKLSAGLNIATILAQTIASAKGSGSKVGSAGAGGAGSVGSPVSTPQPVFNIAGNSGVNQIAQTLAGQQPVKAYVVAKEVTTQQELDRNKITAVKI